MHRTLLVLLAAVALTACYPDLDWRTVNAAEGRFTILMPARPQQETRNIAEGVTMRQWSARAAGALFSAAFADYPDAAAGHIDVVRNALAGRPGAKLAEDRDFSRHGLPGRALAIEFTVPSEGGDAAKPASAKPASAPALAMQV